MRLTSENADAEPDASTTMPGLFDVVRATSYAAATVSLAILLVIFQIGATDVPLRAVVVLLSITLPLNIGIAVLLELVHHVPARQPFPSKLCQWLAFAAGITLSGPLCAVGLVIQHMVPSALYLYVGAVALAFAAYLALRHYLAKR